MSPGNFSPVLNGTRKKINKIDFQWKKKTIFTLAYVPLSFKTYQCSQFIIEWNFKNLIVEETVKIFCYILGNGTESRKFQ